MWSLYFPPDCKQLIKKRNVGHVVIHVSASASTRIRLIVFMSTSAICYLLHMSVHSGYHKWLFLVITTLYKSQTRGNKISTHCMHTHTLAIANTARKSCLGDCYRHEQIECLIKASQIRLIQLIHRINQRKLKTHIAYNATSMAREIRNVRVVWCYMLLQRAHPMLRIWSIVA